MNYRLGRLAIQVEGATPVADCVRDELSPIAAEPGGQSPGLRFRFAAELPERRGRAERLGRLTVFEDGLRARIGRITYDVRREEDRFATSMHVAKQMRRARLLPSWLYRARDWNYLSREENCAKDFVYHAFNYFCQAAGLDAGQSWLHASVLEKDGDAIAVSGWGGTGKTSTSLRLVMRHGYRFLSDDFGLVDEGGMAWRNPVRMQVYPYNLLNDPPLARRLLERRGPLDRSAWLAHKLLRGPSGVRRRISAAALLGPDAVARSARLSTVVFLRRTTEPAISLRPADPQRLARIAANTMLVELGPFVDLSAAVASSRWPEVLPSIVDLAQRTEQILSAAFERARCYELLLPQSSEPDAVVDTLLAASERSLG